jgi:hypothetical protein
VTAFVVVEELLRAEAENNGRTMPMTQCGSCGGEVIQKSRGRIAIVGIVMFAASGLGALSPPLWAVGVVLRAMAAYLLAWASVGRGRWCRGCKQFNGV